MTSRVRQPDRQGFTLIEMTIVVSIIVVLIALLLPAIQNTRESARRNQCMINLHQIGLALENYRHCVGSLPPGVVDPQRPLQLNPKGYHVGWMVHILPYHEQNAVYDLIDFSVGIYDEKNSEATGTRIELYLCPSVVISGNNSAYAGCYNAEETPIDIDNNGVLFLNSHITLDDITDGTSNTIFVGEAGSGLYGWASGTGDTLRNASTAPSDGYDPYGSLRDTQRDPAAPIKPNQMLVGSFQGHHAGGILFSFGDGQVRLLQSKVDKEVYRRLANRHDGELLGSY